MLDKIIKLQVPKALAGGANSLIAALPENPVRIELFARAPEGECQLKLWDHHGRSPEVVNPVCRIDGETKHEWQLRESIQKLDGRTLTWWVRLASDVSTSFELRLQVFQGETLLPEGSFAYSGPLEESELEERAGGFHFKVITDG